MPQAHRFTSAELEQYHRDGYVVVEQLIPPALLAGADAAIQEVTAAALASESFVDILELEPAPADGKPTPRRIYNPFQAHEAFRAMAIEEAVLGRIEQLIGGDFAMQHSKLNMKPARVGSVVEWHQDLTYFPHTNDDLVTTLIYLDDATIENGCLQVLPGKQSGYLNHANADGSFAGMITDDIESAGTPTPLPAPAGSVIFMHCLTPHASLPNRSPSPRRTFIFEYRAADAYPLYFGKQVVRNESFAVHLRGEQKRFARFGKVAPMIPAFDGMVSSLYDLQQKTKSRSDFAHATLSDEGQ